MQLFRGRQSTYAAGTQEKYTLGWTWEQHGEGKKDCYLFNCIKGRVLLSSSALSQRKRDETWFNDKVLLVQAQASGQSVNREELSYLADPELPRHSKLSDTKIASWPISQGMARDAISEGVRLSTSASGSQPSGNTRNDRIRQTPSSNSKNKVEAHPRNVKYSLNKRNGTVKVNGSVSVQNSKKQDNSDYVCINSDDCMSFDNLCVSNSMNDVKFHAKPKKSKSKKDIWKPTGKVFTQIGYIWRPTDRTFTIVGNACPLTRITTTNEVPSRKPIVLESESPKPVVKLVYSRKPRKNKNTESVSKTKVVQIVLWYLDSGCSKHMTGDRSQLTNFISKFLGTVKFGNDQVAKIMGYGDYQIGNVTISRVYYVEGLGHNLFSVGQFCDSNLEVAFRQHTCFIRNLEGVDLLTGSRGDNLYTLSLGNMMASSPICLLSKASKTKSWLWHRRLSHLNFGAINHLARHGLVRGLPKLKFEKDHLCSACALGKSSKKPHKPKSEDTNQEKLYLLHMDLCGPMRVASVNGKKYILVIVDDYSRFTWVKCLRSKDEAPAFIINFLKMIQVRLKETVRRIRTDNGTEFVNQTLREYYEKVGISHETSVARSPQQNGVVERRNRTLIEAARTMLIYAKAPLFLWAEAVATACYTQNRSMIRRRHGKTPYEPSSTTVDQDAPSPSNSHTTQETQTPIISHDVEEDNHDIEVAHMGNDPYFGIPIPEVTSDQSSSSDVIHTIVPPDHQKVWELVPPPDKGNLLTNLKWSKAFAAHMNMVIYQMDVKTAFQNGNLREERRQGTTTGLHISQSPRGIFINQSKYSLESLKNYGFESCDPVDTPMVEKSKLDEDKEGKAVDPSHYHGMIGTLLYLTSSRADLQFAICMCARYQARPIEKHLNAVKRIFQYLKGTVHRGLWYPKDSSFALIAFADADHAGCQDTRHSTSGGIQLLGDTLVSWSSKRQKSAVISSTEAEYIALSGCYAQVLWMRSQLTNYGFGFNKIPMYYDNKSAIALCCNSVQHSRSKHIDIRFHFIKEHVENGMIELYFVNTEYQLADIFTKALGRERIEFLINKLGMRSFTPKTLKKLADDIALDDALVAPADRLKIGKCNLRLSSDVTSKEATLQVVYDVLKLTPFYKAFKSLIDAPEI
ncbi:retrovirus-related pol polyprotein from transposon TNT 1-94 [Tanacetum coccineum]